MVSHQDVSVECKLVVLDCAGPSLCGRDLINMLDKAGVSVLQIGKGAAPGTVQAFSHVNAIRAEYADVFSEELGLMKGPPASLLLKDGAVPKFCKARPLPYALRDKVAKELERMVSLGIIYPVKHSDWATPIVPVLKKDGTVRICGDFKATLNQACAIEQYPLPVIQDMFASLGGGEVFSTLDLKDAYNQVPLDEGARKLCVINTHLGLFSYSRLPFGISSAPAIFQRKMDTMLAGLPGVQAYLDDVLVSEKSADNGARLKAVLQRFREHGVKLRHDKCSFSQASVTYLGHRIDRLGLHPTEKNVEAIVNAPSPRNVGELRSFVGMLTFYSRFLPNMSTTLSPLYLLLEKNTRWQWNLPQETAFIKAKQCLKDAGVLAHYDPLKELKLECDASPHGIGAVLFHTEGSTNRPIGFRSRTLTKAERNYSQLEREALALVFGVTKFRDYLFGREFTLVTDHQPLLGLLRSDRPTPSMAAARIQRWALYLGGYRYKLQYTPGRQLLNSDALSRLPLPLCSPAIEPQDYVFCLESLDEGTVTTRELQHLTERDSTLARIKHYILQGWPRSSKGMEPDIMAFFHRRLELSTAHELVYWGHRVVIPTSARGRLLDLLHENHQGSSAMKSIARSLFWWPGLDREIESLSATCKNCIANLPMPPIAPPANWPQTLEKWSRIHVDFAGPVEGMMILVIVDSHTKWIEAIPLKQATTSATINCLREIFSRFGVPRTIVSDNGTQFTSREFATFVEQNNISHVRTAPFHPQSNGAAERAVRTVKDGLRKMKEGKLEHKLMRLLLSYRRTPQRSGKSPSEMLLGFQIRSRLDTCFPKFSAGVTCESQERVPPVDSRVHVRNYGTGSQWLPGQVISTSGTRMVTVETPGAIVRRHVDQVRLQPPEARQQVSAELACPDKPSLGPEESAPQNDARQSTPPVSPTLVAGPLAPESLPALQSSEAEILREPAQVLRRSTRTRKPVDRF